jgi:hypothetical protein
MAAKVALAGSSQVSLQIGWADVTPYSQAPANERRWVPDLYRERNMQTRDPQSLRCKGSRVIPGRLYLGVVSALQILGHKDSTSIMSPCGGSIHQQTRKVKWLGVLIRRRSTERIRLALDAGEHGLFAHV